MSQPGTGSFEQAILNSSFNPDTGLLQVESLGYDGVGSRVNTSPITATKITTVGEVTYIAKAAPGTAQATAKWQCKKIDATDPNNIIFTWAGNGGFNQVATDLTSLSYS